jgi:hypothetical protein
MDRHRFFLTTHLQLIGSESEDIHADRDGIVQKLATPVPLKSNALSSCYPS